MWRLIIKALKNQHDIKDIVPVNIEPDVCLADGCEQRGGRWWKCAARGAEQTAERRSFLQDPQVNSCARSEVRLLARESEKNPEHVTERLIRSSSACSPTSGVTCRVMKAWTQQSGLHVQHINTLQTELRGVCVCVWFSASAGFRSD